MKTIKEIYKELNKKENKLKIVKALVNDSKKEREQNDERELSK